MKENLLTILPTPDLRLSEANNMLEELKVQMYDAMALPTSILKSNECSRAISIYGWLRQYEMLVAERCLSLLIAEITKNGSQSSEWKT